MAREIIINIYRANAAWFAARWVDGCYDGCDALAAESESAARVEAETMPLEVDGDRVVTRVADA